jgi:hypothetical protein
MITPKAIGGRFVSSGLGIIQNVIMEQGRGVDILENGRKTVYIFSLVTAELAGKHKKEGPKPFAMS